MAQPQLKVRWRFDLSKVPYHQKRLAALKRRGRLYVTECAAQILASLTHSGKVVRQVKLVVASGIELGFKENSLVKRRDFYAEAAKRSLRPCPPSVVEMLRNRYRTQPNGELAIVATEPLVTGNGEMHLLALGGSGSALTIVEVDGDPGTTYFTDRKFIFMLVR